MSFYKYITENRKDSVELKVTMESTVEKLIKHNTNELRPGILLGMIQSGKTRAFTGIIAQYFDKGYDISIVFTKNSIALVDQTIKRLKSEFSMPVERNRLYIWDVIRLQEGQLTGYILKEKNIIVVKKESMNMEALSRLLENVPELRKKKILIVDDEADQAGVSFKADKDSEEGFNLGKIANDLSILRKDLDINASYLQVTATPYSLYLQPEDAIINGEEYAPQRPIFTEILHPHPYYIGGEYYFEKSINCSHSASYIHKQLNPNELDTLNFEGKAKKKGEAKYDKRLRDNIIHTPAFEGFRNAILTYLVGGAIRQEQEKSDDFWAKPYHSALLMHTSPYQRVHKAQKELVELFVDKLQDIKVSELEELIKPLYDRLGLSVNAAGFRILSFVTIRDAIMNALEQNHIGVTEVNSDVQVVELLGDDGQLRLDNPYNIFVGGQSLDRGITIDHLIGFFYGRNPKSFQMDTVLQHSRMYGSRSEKDLSVTRFHTSARIYEAMKRMYWFDKYLRDDFIKNGDNARVKFISKQGNTIKPCGPNKLRASNLMSFKAFSRMLPVGFQTLPMSTIKNNIIEIDNIINNYRNNNENHFSVKGEIALEIIDKINDTFTYEPRFNNVGLDWDIDPVKKAIQIGMEKHNTNIVIIYLQDNREASRIKQDTSFGDAPDDGRTDLPICRGLAINGPVLMLLKQKGEKESGWRGTPFYWPVVIMPANMPNYVYCEE